MPTLSTTYLLPAILLNPAFILHVVNTFVSHIMPPALTVSHSPHPFMESLGPLPGSKLYFDMHEDDQLCWRYTAIMVIVQVLAFGRVQDNRHERRAAKAAKAEREKARKEKIEEEKRLSITKINGHSIGLEGPREGHFQKTNGIPNGIANGQIKPNGPISIEQFKAETESEDGSSVTETSEEEMIV